MALALQTCSSVALDGCCVKSSVAMSDTPKDQDELTEEETERRRDKIAKRMLNTPPKPHKDSIKGSRGTTKRAGARRLSNKGSV